MFAKPKPGFLSLVFSLATVLTLVLSACGPTGTPIQSSSNSGKPVKGGVWIDDLVNEPDSFIPNASVQTFATMVMQGLYAPIFVGTSKGLIQPGIATEVPTVQNGGISADSKTWIFHLRPNLVWSDGQPLNADDVDFTWKLWTNPKFAAASTAILKHIQSADVSADKLTITFHLKDAFSAFLPAWTDGGLAPLPKHHFESIPPDQIKKSKDNLFPTVTSGPFMMSESKSGDHYTLVRNPKYYLASQGLPYLDKVIFRPVANQETVLKDLQSGSIDSAWFLDAAKLPTYKQLTDYDLVQGTSASYEAIHFNENNPALKDVNVRKAIALAVNQSELIKIARLGAALPMCTDHSPAYTPGYQADAQCPTFDLNAANKLLDDAGWTKGSDGIRAKGGLRLEFQYSTTANNAWRAQDETINQANFAKIGVKVDIRNYPASTFFSTFLGGGKAGTYDMAEWASSYSYDPNDATQLECDQIGKNNFNWYCNPQMDALLLKEEQIADPTQRQQIFNQIHQLILTDFPFATEFSPNDLSVHKKGTFNYAPGPFAASETVNIWNWWCNNGKCPSAG
ncbi:MAG TPA: peptide ABC transporter substrate-binding protein [Ktedonobacteraceae bacterium]|nr:peptide ABC transporter substrate-binding protein [Ktedonobacteraceae bacterium]